MPIYIDNTQSAGKRGIKVELIVLYLFTTKAGLFFTFSQILPIILASYQKWDTGATVLYYYVYSLVIVLATTALALLWQPKNPAAKTVFFNGKKADFLGRGCSSLVILGWFSPVIFMSIIFLPVVFSTSFIVKSGILGIYSGLAYLIGFYHVQNRAVVSGITSTDLARVFTIFLAPYLRLGAITTIMPVTISTINPLLLLLAIAVTELIIYGLQNAPGAVPLTVKTTENN